MVAVSSFALLASCVPAVDAAAAIPVKPEILSFKEKGCLRELSFQFQHNDALPQGDAGTCSTSGHLFADGLPASTQERAVEIDLATSLSADDAKLLAETVGGPNHLTFDWLACGHPPDAWKKPHYDLHIFKVSKANRPPACIPEEGYTGPSYVCRASTNPKYMQYGDAGDQVLEGMGEDAYGIRGQGNHWAVRPVVNPDFTDPEIVFQTYDSQVVGFETMLPVAWFIVPSALRNYTFAYKDSSALPAGWHPISIQEEVIDANKKFKVSVLYDSFPTRCSKAMAPLLAARDAGDSTTDTEAEESDHGHITVPSLFVLLSTFVRSFDF